ncbi:MAG: MFS transporter [Clostridia bacterium]|nr:MFS transporter [Clostridia bacterium]
MNTKAKKNNIWFIYILGYMVYCAVYVCRFNLNIAGTVLQQSGMLTAAQYGLMGSAFSATYAVGRIVNGYLGDYISKRIMIAGGIILSGLANLVVGFFPPFQAILIVWAVNGYAQSMIWGPLLYSVTRNVPEKHLNTATSIFPSSVATGSVLGILAATFAISSLGMSWAFFLPSIIGMSLGAAVLLFFKDDNSSAAKASGKQSFLVPDRRIIPVAFTAFLHGWIKDSVSYWAALIFLKKYAIDIGSIAGFVLLVPALGLIGRLAYPFVFKKCGECEHRTSITGFVCCILAAGMLCLPLPAVITALCLCFISATISMINTSMLSIFPMRFAATGNVSSVSGIMDFATYLGSSLSAALFGWMFTGSDNFSAMYIIWIAVAAVSIVILSIYKKRRSA